jgi:hypothetical protein
MQLASSLLITALLNIIVFELACSSVQAIVLVLLGVPLLLFELVDDEIFGTFALSRKKCTTTSVVPQHLADVRYTHASVL